MGSARARGAQRGYLPEIIDIIKHRRDTSSLDEADAVVIELGREIFGARRLASAASDHLMLVELCHVCEFIRRVVLEISLTAGVSADCRT